MNVIYLQKIGVWQFQLEEMSKDEEDTIVTDSPNRALFTFDEICLIAPSCKAKNKNLQAELNAYLDKDCYDFSMDFI